MWNQAKAWGYVQHEPFTGLLLPDRNALNARCLTLPEMRAVIETAAEPYKTYYWILAETGVRAGEIGGLPITNLFHDQGAIRVAQSVWHGKIETVKSKNDNRICEISPQFGRHLRSYVASWRPNPLNLLLATSNGTPLDTDTCANVSSYPLRKKVGFSVAGFMHFGTVTRR
jgi:integrase